jgi:23S rRNA (uracil1939-C5)-methyltransferase
MIAKGQILEKVLITDFANEGKAMSRVEGKVIFVSGAVPGDVADIFITKNKKDWAEGRLQQLHKASEWRAIPFCEHFGICGGCKWQHLNYKKQLEFKEQSVIENLKRIGKIEIREIIPIAGAEEIKFYRNKLEYTFSNKAWLTKDELNNQAPNRNALGFHIPQLFDKVLDIKTCYLQADPSNSIRVAVKDFAEKNQFYFFDVKQKKGLLRNLTIRTSSTGQIMVLLSFGESDEEKIQSLLNFTIEKFPEVTSLCYVINKKGNDTIYDLEINVFQGQDYIEEKLDSLIFRIHPKSFFQTNSRQAEKLYRIVSDFAALKENETVYDLYSGTGSIALYVSRFCKNVVGIEQIEEAVRDARLNAIINNIENARFFSGDMKDVFTDDFILQNAKPDVVITDPPRNGMHEDVSRQLLKLNAPRIVYVSCNSATQARDLTILSEKYSVEKSQAVDMFPHTHHVENVVLLKLK